MILAAETFAAHVKMHMIAVGGVIFGAEHGAETFAGAAVDGGEELTFIVTAVPLFQDGDPAPSFQTKPRNFDRIGVSVLRKFRRASDFAAIIAAHGFDARQFATEILAGGAFYGIFCPSCKFAGELAFDRTEIGYIGADVEQFNAVDLTASPTEIAVG